MELNLFGYLMGNHHKEKEENWQEEKKSKKKLKIKWRKQKKLVI